jgi:hypothetical protein
MQGSMGLEYLSDSSTANDRGACTQLDGFIRTANASAGVMQVAMPNVAKGISTLCRIQNLDMH